MKKVMVKREGPFNWVVKVDGRYIDEFWRATNAIRLAYDIQEALDIPERDEE